MLPLLKNINVAVRIATDQITITERHLFGRTKWHSLQLQHPAHTIQGMSELCEFLQNLSPTKLLIVAPTSWFLLTAIPWLSSKSQSADYILAAQEIMRGDSDFNPDDYWHGAYHPIYGKGNIVYAIHHQLIGPLQQLGLTLTIIPDLFIAIPHLINRGGLFTSHDLALTYQESPDNIELKYRRTSHTEFQATIAQLTTNTTTPITWVNVNDKLNHIPTKTVHRYDYNAKQELNIHKTRWPLYTRKTDAAFPWVIVIATILFAIFCKQQMNALQTTHSQLAYTIQKAQNTASQQHNLYNTAGMSYIQPISERLTFPWDQMLNIFYQPNTPVTLLSTDIDTLSNIKLNVQFTRSALLWHWIETLKASLPKHSIEVTHIVKTDNKDYLAEISIK